MKLVTKTAADYRQVVVFRLAGDEYGIDVQHVKEVHRPLPLTHYPQAPPMVRGMANLRGDVIPVIDLRFRMGLSPGEETADTRMLIVWLDDRLVALLADHVSEVLRVPVAAIDPPLAMPTSVSPEFVSGVAKIEDRLIVLLELQRLFSGVEKAALAAAASQPAQPEPEKESTVPAPGDTPIIV